MADSSNNPRPGTSNRKRTSAGSFVGHEDLITEWLEEESEHEFSDIDDEDDDPTFEPEIQHNEEDVMSCEDDPELNLEARQEPAPVVERQRSSDESQDHYTGKNGFIWSKQERSRTSRIAHHNIIRLPGRTTTTNFEGYSKLWSKLIDPTMLESLVRFKGGVDEVDKKCSIYCCSRKTRRWPMAIFQRILDIAGINSFLLYQSCADSDNKMRRATFLLNMARDLVLNHMKARVYNERLPRELHMTITRVLGEDIPPPPPVVRSVPPSGRKLCSICPTKIKRQTKYCCCDCSKPICLQCSKPLCENCQTKL